MVNTLGPIWIIRDNVSILRSFTRKLNSVCNLNSPLFCKVIYLQGLGIRPSLVNAISGKAFILPITVIITLPLHKIILNCSSKWYMYLHCLCMCVRLLVVPYTYKHESFKILKWYPVWWMWLVSHWESFHEIIGCWSLLSVYCPFLFYF